MLAECLRSFEEQRPSRVGEVVVVDNSVEVEGQPPSAEFPWIDYELNDENRHFRGGVNQGVRSARLHYVLLLNPDTYLTDSDSIAKLAETLDGDPTSVSSPRSCAATTGCSRRRASAWPVSRTSSR